ncbi:MAG: DUF3857 domain-containing protein [Candidatus Bipolaricaulis sp.]|nr:DUF3857 domain-containing protein [Candidatus Bipolaricaulis sp.]
MSLAMAAILAATSWIAAAGQQAGSAGWTESGTEVMANLPAAGKYSNEDAVELLREHSEELLPDGAVVSRVHHRWWVRTLRGVGALKVANIPYAADLVTIEGVAARTIRADGTEIQATAISDFKQPTGNIPVSNDDRTRRIGFPSVCAGCVVEYEVTSRTSADSPLPLLFGTFLLRDDYVIVRQVYSLKVPEGGVLNWEVLGGDDVEVEKSRDGQSVRLALAEVEAGRDEPGMPCPEDVWPQIRYSSLAVWAELAEHWRKLNADATSKDLGVLAAADSVTAGAESQDEIIDRLYTYVRDEIQYYAISLGRGGSVAAPSAETLQKRRGDCQAMTALLVTMLRHVGIEAYPAMVSTSCMLSGAFRGIPSYPTTIDHVVTVCRRSDGSDWRVLDPTHKYDTPYSKPWAGHTIWILDGEPGAPGTAYAVPEWTAAANRIRSVLDATLADDGALQTRAVLTATGYPASRYASALQFYDPAYWKPLLFIELSHMLPRDSNPTLMISGNVQVASMQDPVEIYIPYAVSDYLNYATEEGQLLPCSPEIFFNPTTSLGAGAAWGLERLVPSTLEARTYPFLATACVWEYDLTLHLPAGWSVDLAAAGLNWTGVRYELESSCSGGTYRAAYAFADGVLEVHRELTVA